VEERREKINRKKEIKTWDGELAIGKSEVTYIVCRGKSFILGKKGR